MRAKTMLRGITRLFSRVQKLDLRCFLHVSAQAPQSNPVPAERPRTVSRTSDSDPAKHGEQHEGQYYSIPLQDLKTVFPHGLPPRYMMQVKTFGEACLMVRKPALELLGYLKNTKFTHPAVRYVLCILPTCLGPRAFPSFGRRRCWVWDKVLLCISGWPHSCRSAESWCETLWVGNALLMTMFSLAHALDGEKGTGKTLSLCHAVHFCAKHDWLVLHIPDAHLWVKNCRELLQSTYNKERFDQPLEASTWLKNFKTTNKRFLSQIKVQGKYIWNKRESTEKGSPLGEVVEQGLTRVRNATDAVGIVLKELRSQSSEGHFRLLVAVDGVNALWGRTTLKREDRTLIAPEELSLVHSLRKMVKNDWHGGAIVLSLSQTGSLFKSRAAYLPHELLGKEGFDALDPFLPILISNYNPKEFESSFQYYLENNWLQHEKAPTEEGRKELKFLSNCNPGQLERLCAAL